jgi:DNA mismatch repair protein MutS
VKNFHVGTKEIGQKVIFLRKLIPGGSEHSFGIHVAKMAGMPKSIILRASEILTKLEQKSLSAKTDKHDKDHIQTVLNTPTPEALQLSIFETVDPALGKVKEMLLDLNVNAMTPIECMMQLIELKKIFDED